MGLLSAISVVRHLHSVQRRSFLVKPFLAYPIIQKCFKSNIPGSVKEYIERGKTAAKNPSKCLLSLEDLIRNHNESDIYSKALPPKELNNGSKDEFFIALALPSMTGKTQMAFNIRSKRPLYFVMDDNQSVYGGFRDISVKLGKLLKSDFENARKIVISEINVGTLTSSSYIEDAKEKATEIITLDFLKKYLRDYEFESLGYLAALIKECEKGYMDSTNDEWMRFYAANQDPFLLLKYKPLSLIDLKCQKDVYEALLEKYLFFIDEFNAVPGIVMLRNISRFLKTPCIVASTNSKVINLIGASEMTGSGSSPPSVFCAAFPRLSTLSDKEVAQFFNEKIDCERFFELSKNVSEVEEKRMRLLFEFFKHQILKSRPGVSLYLFEALESISKSLPELESLKVDFVFQEVLYFMSKYTKNRKRIAFGQIPGMKANVDLLGGNHFDPTYVPPADSKNDDSSLIDHHFFYLKNPRTDLEPEQPYVLFHKADEEPMIVSDPDSKLSFSTQGYFDESEELMKLVCLFTEMYHSSYGVFYPPLAKGSRLGIDKGEYLEVITYAAFLDSSHFNDQKLVSLEGVGIKDFLRNLLSNLNSQSKYVRSFIKNLKVNYQNVKDDHILAKTVVPCLYIANHDWPAEIKAIFDPKESTFKLGKYTRTPNETEIDAAVDLIDKDGRKCLGVVECKNRAEPLKKTLYKPIIEKAFQYAKVEKIESFLNSLRPIIKPEMIGSFEQFTEIDLKKLDSGNADAASTREEEEAITRFKNFIQNFEDSNKFQVVQGKLKDYVKEEHLNEFESLLKNLDGLKDACPLVHFLICKSCTNLRSLGNEFSGRKINFFRFAKTGKDYEITSVNSKLYEDPEMVAFIIETDVVNDIQISGKEPSESKTKRKSKKKST